MPEWSDGNKYLFCGDFKAAQPGYARVLAVKLAGETVSMHCADGRLASFDSSVRFRRLVSSAKENVYEALLAWMGPTALESRCWRCSC